jgi:AmmeMemoRadiSam system protein A
VRRRLAPAVALLAALAGATAADALEGAPPAPAASLSPEPPEEVRPAPATSAEPAASPTPLDCLARPLDAAERDTLLRLAWRTLSGHLTGNPIKDADLELYTFGPCLMARRGLFVTLKKGEQVRGLQGEIEPTRPLYQQVIVFTRRAATRDPRFLPLTERDLGGLTLDLSIVSERTRVDGPDRIHLETDGVFLEKWGRRAIFLPGIAVKQGWTVERTLDELCAQAALPKGSWSESSRIEVFTTEEVAGGPPSEAPPAPAPVPSASPEPSPTPAAPSGGRRT